MNAYEYGLKYFKVKYQPKPNCVVFNNKLHVQGEEEEHTLTDYEPSIFSYKQVALVNGTNYQHILEPKRLNADVVEDYLIPNNYITVTEGNTVVGIGTGLVAVYKYEDEYYVKTEFSPTEYLDEVAIVNSTSKKGSLVPKIFGLADIKLRKILEDDSISLVFFFNEDGAVLENAYSSITTIEANEIIFFLEKDSLFNPVSVIKVKSGSGIAKDKILPFSSIATLAQLVGVHIEEKHIKKVFENHFKNKNKEDEFTINTIFYEMGEFVLEITGAVLKGLFGDPLIIIGRELSAGLKIDKKRWQYYDKEGNINSEFAPIFPGFKSFLDKDEKSNEGETLASKLTELKETVTNTIQKVPNSDFRAFIKDKLSFVFKTLDALEEMYKSFIKLINSKSLFIFLNALFLGVYNSIVEAIGGIITIIGHVINIPSYLVKVDDAKISQAANVGREVLENVTETFLKLFSIKNIKALFTGFLKIGETLLTTMANPNEVLSKIADGVNYTATKVDRIGYVIGYAVGFIIEEVLTILATGGAKTIAQAFKLTIESLATVLTKTKNAAKIVVKKPADFINALSVLFKKLKALDVQKLMDEFVVWIQQLLKTTKQLATEKYNELFNFSEKFWLSKFKLTPTSFKDGLVIFCPTLK